MKTPEQQFEEVREYLIENSSPEYVFDHDDDFFGKVVWKIGELRYIEYIQVIRNEDDDSYSIDEDGFFDCISLKKLKKVFADFPASGWEDFFEYFENETGYETHSVEYSECSAVRLGKDKSAIMYSAEVLDSNEDDMLYIYNYANSLIEKEKLDKRHGISSQKTISDAL